jgi:hypothetical protein
LGRFLIKTEFSKPLEFSSQQVAANTNTAVVLSWPTIDPGIIKEGTSYIRLRISNFDSRAVSNDLPGTPEDDRSIIALNNGETEDYLIQTALPVNIVSFSVKSQEQSTQVLWATTQETNSERFEIEHRLNGSTWNKIGEIASHQESSDMKNYSFLHTNPSGGANYYRLKMIDKDNSFAYSRIRSIHFDTKNEFNVYPNPVTDKLLFKNFERIKEVTLYNPSGKQVFRKKNVSVQGIDVNSLPVGNYTVEVIQVDGTQKKHNILITR